MRVLVTGHKGFIGSVMVPALPRDGIDVDGMDTDLYRECTFVGSLANVPEIERDIRDATPATSKASTPSFTSRRCPTTRSATSIPN